MVKLDKRVAELLDNQEGWTWQHVSGRLVKWANEDGSQEGPLVFISATDAETFGNLIIQPARKWKRKVAYITRDGLWHINGQVSAYLWINLSPLTYCMLKVEVGS